MQLNINAAAQKRLPAGVAKPLSKYSGSFGFCPFGDMAG
jgi:hypothetical protein